MLVPADGRQDLDVAAGVVRVAGQFEADRVMGAGDRVERLRDGARRTSVHVQAARAVSRLPIGADVVDRAGRDGPACDGGAVDGENGRETARVRSVLKTSVLERGCVCGAADRKRGADPKKSGRQRPVIFGCMGQVTFSNLGYLTNRAIAMPGCKSLRTRAFPPGPRPANVKFTDRRKVTERTAETTTTQRAWRSRRRAGPQQR